MTRAIWTGSISFGLVNVPVRMYSAIEEHTLHFNFVHGPIEAGHSQVNVVRPHLPPHHRSSVVLGAAE
jgi:non-homologous end joining protein Ku